MTTISPRPEMRVGRYRLLSVIGEGGMGVVHLAEAPDGRRVALKVLRPHVIGDQEARDRLAREVGSLSRVRSPRVAEIVDADPYGEIPFVATRYVPGPTLHALVKQQGPIPDDDLVWFAEGLADALLAVHRVGVLHRDVKPTNVLVEGRSPVLIDFGLARLAEDPRLTATGWLLGTPGYLAPEILYGDEPTPASDVHAWAATLVHAATGRAPYGTGPAMAIMDRVRRGEHDLAGVPGQLRELLATCLDPDPLARPPLVELHQELLRRLGAEPARSADEEPTARVPLLPEPRPVPTPIRTARRYDDEPRPTAVLPVEQRPPRLPEWSVARPAEEQGLAPVPPPERLGRRRWALLGIGLFGTALVAAAPYLGALVLVVLVCLVRMASVTRQRHTRRRDLRGGRRRWFDVPASTLASPGYLMFSLTGSLVLVAWSVAVALAAAVVLALARAPLAAALGIVGLVFVLSLWWGPASGRVREMARIALRPLAADGARTGAFFALTAVGALVLAALLSVQGPNWSPGVSAPWTHGFLHEMDRALH